MTRARSAEAKTILAAPECKHSAATSPGVIAGMKTRQSAKIQELGQALVDAGFRRLDEQAYVLGLSRSTAWTILKACHKSSGLSASIIERMLGSSKLPPRARSILVQYVEEKSFGLYGGSRRRQQRFAVRLSNTIVSSSGSDQRQRRGREEMPAAKFFATWDAHLTSALPGPVEQRGPATVEHDQRAASNSSCQ